MTYEPQTSIGHFLCRSHPAGCHINPPLAADLVIVALKWCTFHDFVYWKTRSMIPTLSEQNFLCATVVMFLFRNRSNQHCFGNSIGGTLLGNPLRTDLVQKTFNIIYNCQKIGSRHLSVACKTFQDRLLSPPTSTDQQQRQVHCATVST